MTLTRNIFPIFFCALSAASVLQLSSFNIQMFGKSKMKKPQVIDILVKILIRYDVIFIQEIRDINQIAIYQLLDEVNSVSNDFNLALSERLGRTNSKEQYAYFYRESKLQLLETYQYEDVNDIFERPPFAVRFKSIADNVEFGMLGVHAKPDKSLTKIELDALVDVYDEVSVEWSLEDFIISGDMNAACTYLDPADWSWIRLRTQPRFRWLIDDDSDTTVRASTSCAYDRMILVGTNMQHGFIPPSRIFKFDKQYKLPEKRALKISDHYVISSEISLAPGKSCAQAVASEGRSGHRSGLGAAVLTFVQCLSKLVK